MDFEEKTLKRTEIYQGPIFNLVKDKVQLPAGKGTAYRDLIFHNGAVAVIALTSENKMILVKQYRKAIEATSYEIPAGKLEVGEMRILRPQLYVNWKKKLAIPVNWSCSMISIRRLAFAMSESDFIALAI